jgi:hypothetical protein
MPTRAQHEYFVRRRPYRAWLMIQNSKGERVGALHLTHRNEIGIYILRKYRKKGVRERGDPARAGDHRAAARTARDPTGPLQRQRRAA